MKVNISLNEADVLKISTRGLDFLLLKGLYNLGEISKAEMDFLANEKVEQPHRKEIVIDFRDIESIDFSLRDGLHNLYKNGFKIIGEKQ